VDEPRRLLAELEDSPALSALPRAIRARVEEQLRIIGDAQVQIYVALSPLTLGKQLR
jgi:hypothetical protein